MEPLNKKGDEDEVKNYKGITLMDTGYKIYAGIIRDKLEKVLERTGLLDDTQMGFRKGRGTADVVHKMNKAIKDKLLLQI